MKWHTVASVAVSIRLTVPPQEQASTWNGKMGVVHQPLPQLIKAPTGSFCPLVGSGFCLVAQTHREQSRLG